MSFIKKDRKILIENYLKKLGFLPEEIQRFLKDKIFIYSPIKDDDIFSEKYKILYFFYRDENELFEQHKDFWNENKIPVFIAINDQKSFIIDVKQKPDRKNPTSLSIKSFNYGVNSKEFAEEDIKELHKENIDNSYFWNFVIDTRKKNKEKKVDEDLLNNLVLLKKELINNTSDDDNINLLILQCLFIKYLEDRKVFDKDSLLSALKIGNENSLKKVFNKITIINGDLFSRIDYKINTEQLNELAIFFEHDYSEYKKREQLSIFFPYKFDKIPIELISNVYEEFLGKTDKSKKKSQGVFYTRTFVVDFMLSHTVYEQVKNNKKLTVLDPACGSGIFLVQSYKAILKKHKNITIEEKVDILKKQIFGIDIDKKALQIAAFSLYLVLLEKEKKEDIQKLIQDKISILPSLLDSNLLQKNAITDKISFKIERKEINCFDCIVGNPPWGQIREFEYSFNHSLEILKDKNIPESIINKLKTKKIKTDQFKKNLEKILDSEERKYIDKIIKYSEIDDIERVKERKIHNKEFDGLYNNVSLFQRSQCFLLRINEWSHKNTMISFIVNNSNFLNEKAEDFRKEMLRTYNITKYYDLSNISSILFKGPEPSAVLIMDKKKNSENILEYYTAQLTDMANLLNLIHCSSNDIKEIKQADLLEEGQDVIWKIFVNGNWDDYQLLKKVYFARDKNISYKICERGINPNSSQQKGEPVFRDYLTNEAFDSYFLTKDKLNKINWNQKFERKRTNEKELFAGNRIILKRQPTIKDNLLLKCILTNIDLVFGEGYYCIKYNKLEDYNPYLAILNSSFIGYYINMISSQTNIGKKRTAIRKDELLQLPYPKLNDNNPKVIRLIKLVERIQNLKKEKKSTDDLEVQIDELVFDIYGLLDFEKEIIREFYDVNVYRKREEASRKDIQKYVDKFRDVFSFILDDKLVLNAEYSFHNIGAAVCFSIVNKEDFESKIIKADPKILEIVKKKQLEESLLSKAIKEEKIKIYTEENFTIVKSKYFKDWTVRQAMKDANEEIGLIVQKLPDE